MVSVSVLVPEERLGEFYAALGEWLVGSSEEGPQRAPVRVQAPGKAARYAPITEFLSGVSGDAVEVSFEEIEEVLGEPLPLSARKHRSFWANSPRPTQARSWLSAGWEVTGLDWDQQRLTFRRKAE